MIHKKTHITSTEPLLQNVLRWVLVTRPGRNNGARKALYDIRSASDSANRARTRACIPFEFWALHCCSVRPSQRHRLVYRHISLFGSGNVFLLKSIVLLHKTKFLYWKAWFCLVRQLFCFVKHSLSIEKALFCLVKLSFSIEKHCFA